MLYAPPTKDSKKTHFKPKQKDTIKTATAFNNHQNPTPTTKTISLHNQ